MDGQTDDARAQGGKGGALMRGAGRNGFALLAMALVTGACQGNAGAAPTPETRAIPAATSVPVPTPKPSPAPTPAGDADKPFGDRVILKKGMSAEVAPSATLSFVDIVSDSRCPEGAQCVWAGEVTIAMTLATPLGNKSFELSGHAATQSALSYRVELLEYGPCPGGPAITPLPGECAQLKVGPDSAP